jgi:hypothetical protein
MNKSEDQRFEDAFDQIMRWYRDESGRYQLSPSLEARLGRWKAAREFILTFRPLTDSIVVNFLMQQYQVSEPQAWRDVRDTKRCFASMEKVNKEFERIMLVAQIQSLRTMALKDSNYEVAAKCDATLAKMGQFTEPDVDPGAQAGKKIELHIAFNPALAGAKAIPNLLETARKFIGDVRASRELMMGNVEFVDRDGKGIS